MSELVDELIPTRGSLINRLKDWRDQSSWQDFFDTYWKLIYGVARRAGLNDAEAQDVVQETMVTVAKYIPEFNYDPAIGEFKSWLLRITHCRIVDQFRKRGRMAPLSHEAGESQEPPDLADPATGHFEKLWDAEWEHNLLEAAKARVKRRANPEHYQLFEFYVTKEWPAEKVAAHFGVSINQVYLAKNRIKELLIEESKRLEKGLL